MLRLFVRPFDASFAAGVLRVDMCDLLGPNASRMCEIRVTWDDAYGQEHEFITSDADRYIEGNTLYKSVGFVCQ